MDNSHITSAKNLIDTLLQKAYQSGISEQAFLNNLYIEACLTLWSNMEANKGKSPAQIKQEKKNFLNDITSGQRKITLPEVIETIYNARRTANFPENTTNRARLQAVLETKSTDMDKIEENRWHFRLPKNRHAKGWSSQNKSVERLIVNANPNPAMIGVLDAFCQKHNCYYKTPAADDFSYRVDTVVVYSSQKISDIAKKEFITQLSPFVRTSLPDRTNDLDGQLLATGISWAKEASKAELNTLLTHLHLPDENTFRKEFSDKKANDGSLKMSLGQRCVLEQVGRFYNRHFGQKKAQAEVVRTHNVYQTKTGNALFIPKKNIDETVAREALRRTGLILDSVTDQTSGKTYFIADPKKGANKQTLDNISALVLQKTKPNGASR